MRKSLLTVPALFVMLFFIFSTGCGGDAGENSVELKTDSDKGKLQSRV